MDFRPASGGRLTRVEEGDWAGLEASSRPSRGTPSARGRREMVRKCAFCGGTSGVYYSDPERGPVCQDCWFKLGQELEDIEEEEKKARKAKRLKELRGEYEPESR